MTSDGRAVRAREAHKASRDADAVARHHRDVRNTLIRTLRAEDPGYWTYTRLAAAVGCTKELVAAIITGRAR